MHSQHVEQLVQMIADAVKTYGFSVANSDSTLDAHFIKSADSSCLNDQFRQLEVPVNVPVGVSARHIHLSRPHVDMLFGAGHQLVRKAELMGGQFAAAETVTIVGTNMQAIENVRVLGPERKQTQVEISATDRIKLGVAAPLRDSGDIQKSASVTIIGPKGSVYLDEGCIVAARHIHMSPDDAASFGVSDGDIVSAEINGERGLQLDNIKIRTDASFTLEMHIDTDEANACLLKTGDNVRIFIR